ncbi:MAG: hypothetical protein COU09_01420 [Candidatus Harrisonbacteria bacterium CG10_big_fil_rev_8_21_14_0_10_44_23]|uniref:PpiC domain-containing protein n=1 Tax=Candidatus Harrisonbacteria bacterium CG10_big_fil_rev_8_21_14_0_10_44_23 TaxID=1974585 RepID=A0A2H0US57_9BACT|nr:MAG: hypothetical protein COU09_01420 [Candidatus Harrisonbacteria bacterium CG10_big_fil_rev_8_21_14_0_10_44_23]
MKYQKLFIIAVVFILIIFGAYYFLSQKNYPIANVGQGLIAAKDFDISFNAALSFYRQQASQQGADDPATDKEFLKELKRATLEKLVDVEIVHGSLYEKMETKEIKQSINSQLEAIEQNNTEENVTAIENLFNVSWQEFERLILIPEAETALLIQDLNSKSIDFNTWLEARKKDLEIEIFYPGYFWDGESVKAN